MPIMDGWHLREFHVASKIGWPLLCVEDLSGRWKVVGPLREFQKSIVDGLLGGGAELSRNDSRVRVSA